MSTYNPERNTVSSPQVMKSAAGYYVGTGMNDIIDHPLAWINPYSRESGYFKTEREATIELESMK